VILLLTGTYFARDASYAHEYTDVKLMEKTPSDDVDTGRLSTAAAAAGGGACVDELMTADEAADKSETRAAWSADDRTDEETTGSRRQLRVMVAARVYVGRYTAGHRTYRKPPPLDSTQLLSATFDSCVNYTDEPTLFVVFDSSQCYPEYFITYRCQSQPFTT